jgi:tetratricopeptide (TPR) repeat protein
MLAKKKRTGNKWIFLLALAVLLGGCKPPGPRALLDGKQLLDQGRYAEAVQRLQTATTLLTTNAQAWNYLGLAYHRAGQPTDAEQAYQKSIALNHDLVEAHFNLGCLWLEQNKLEPAKAQLTTYTQLRVNSADGWLKLGAAQLRSRELAAAEKSFREVLRVSPQNAEGLNGLGLIQLQRNRAREAAQFFAAAVRQDPHYRPALLNLATVSCQYLNSRQFALQKYREYLALTPRAANWDAVNAIAQTLEQQPAPPPHPAQTNVPTQTAAVTNAPQTQTVNATRAASPTKPELVTNNARTSPLPPPSPPPVVAAPPVEVEAVKLPHEPVIRTAEDSVASTGTSGLVASADTPAASAGSPKPVKRSLLARLNPINLFRREPKPAQQLTPLPPATASAPLNVARGASVASATMPGAELSVPSVVTPSPLTSGVPQSFPRYTYISPASLTAGNRSEAERAFAQGTQMQRAKKWAGAVSSYRQATQLDPSYFEAQYNLGLAAFEARNFRLALVACENALAIRSDSVDARYNFALVLKAANYPLDAAAELERILAANPNETRVHLTLGNLYAQQLQDPAKARVHYLKVLELEPQHSQATSIRYWLVANPP